MLYSTFFRINGVGFKMCLTKSVSILTIYNQKGRCLKRGKHDSEYIAIFKVSKLYAESASIVYFKVNFKLTCVQSSEQVVKI